MSILTLLIIVLLVLWLTGSVAIGGQLIHVLLIVVFILVVMRLMQGRKVL